MLERDVEAYFRRAVEAAGGVAFKFVSPSHRGVSDRIVCLPGQTWFVELKRPGGRLMPLQRIFAEEMKRLGQLYACLSSKEEVDQWIENLCGREAAPAPCEPCGPKARRRGRSCAS